MPFHFLEPEPESMEKRLRVIEEISERTSGFWTNAHGWAPKESADLLSKSRLDWLDSFNRTLRARVEDVIEHPDEPAVLILAWAHLRTLVEGHLKLLLAVFLVDYLKDAHAPTTKNGAKIVPDSLKYDAIRQFLVKRDLLVSHHAFIDKVQQRGNAIHVFAEKPIGTAEEYLDNVANYRKFLVDIETSLPNPYV
jgi:hypothetical protein